MNGRIASALCRVFGSMLERYKKADEHEHSPIFDESYFGHRFFEEMLAAIPEFEGKLKWQDQCSSLKIDLHAAGEFAAELKWIRRTGPTKSGKECSSSAKTIGRCAADVCRLAHIYASHNHIGCWFVLGGDSRAFFDMFYSSDWGCVVQSFLPYRHSDVQILKSLGVIDSWVSPRRLDSKGPLQHMLERLLKKNNRRKETQLKLPETIRCLPHWYFPAGHLPAKIGHDDPWSNTDFVNSDFSFCAWRIETSGDKTFSI
jgi:hypothetical protein